MSGSFDARKPYRRGVASRLIVVAWCFFAILVGLASVIVRLGTKGGGSYGDIFVLLGLLGFLFTAWSVVALWQFLHGGASRLHPVVASVFASITLLLIALAIGLRG
jgi:hypothetical protein